MKFKVCNKKFIISNKTVVCILEVEVDKCALTHVEYAVMELINWKRFKINHDSPLHVGMTFKGIAKCMDGDTFDEHKGKILAECRAMEKLKRYSSNFFYDCANKASELSDKFMKIAENEANLRNANNAKISEILIGL